MDEDSLLGYLHGLEKEGFSFWTDQDIFTTEMWDDRIKPEITATDITLVLVSQPFLNSAYCQDVEIALFLGLRKKAGLKVYPVVLSPCDWKTHDWLASTQFQPRGRQTVAVNYKDKGKRAGLYLEILQELRELGKQIRGEP